MQMQKHDLHYNFFGPKPAKLSFINFTVDWQLKYTHGGTIILCPWKIHLSWKSFWRHVSGNLQPLDISQPKISWNFLYYFQEYSYSTANMFTAVICALFFPDKFNITVFILFSMLFLFAGIYCYEKKNLHIQFPDSNSCPSAKEKGVKWPLHLFILFFLYFIIKLKPILPSFISLSS